DPRAAGFPGRRTGPLRARRGPVPARRARPRQAPLPDRARRAAEPGAARARPRPAGAHGRRRDATGGTLMDGAEHTGAAGAPDPHTARRAAARAAGLGVVVAVLYLGASLCALPAYGLAWDEA